MVVLMNERVIVLWEALNCQCSVSTFQYTPFILNLTFRNQKGAGFQNLKEGINARFRNLPLEINHLVSKQSNRLCRQKQELLPINGSIE